MREILLVAGETSGDMHAAGVARELRARGASYHLVGTGGERMRVEGVELLEHSRRMAMMGFLGPLAQLPSAMSLLRTLSRRLRGGSVALVILVDYPEFNMLVARSAHDAGVPVLYYITPQVWAWRPGRMRRLARSVARAAVILPFEEQLLRSHGIDATFVGHPLLDRARDLPDGPRARAALGLAQDRPVLAMFPGSRAQEIARHLDPFVATASLLSQRVSGLQVVVSGAPDVTIDPARCPYPVIPSDSFTVLRAADAALCKSGTTTLEAAVTGCPLVLAYRTSAVEYGIARRLVSLRDIGLVNVVAGRRIVPEFVQDALVPYAVADALLPLLDRRSPARATMVEELGAVREALGTPGASGRVADMALSIAKGGSE